MGLFRTEKRYDDSRAELELAEMKNEYDGLFMRKRNALRDDRPSQDSDLFGPELEDYAVPFVPMLKWSLKPGKMIPSMKDYDRYGNLGALCQERSDRLNRNELWNKYGKSMHFLTLEFEDPEVETAYSEDYLRRNKRCVEYATLSTGMALMLKLAVNLFYWGVFDEAFAILSPIIIIKYWLFIFYRRHFYCHFQSFLLTFALIEATVLCTHIAFRLPSTLLFYQRSSDSYLTYTEDHMPVIETQNTHTSVLLFFAILLTTYRLRFAYLFLAYAYTITLLCIFLSSTHDNCDCETDPIWFYMQSSGMRNSKNMCDTVKLSACIRYIWTHEHPSSFFSAFPMGTVSQIAGSACLLAFLSYSLEVLQRKDFVQATMVFKETHINDLLLHNILPRHIIDRIQRLEKQKLADKIHTSGWNYYREVKNNNVNGSLADPYGNVTMLFADIVSFTSMSAEISPEKIVALLNHLFHVLDGLAMTNGVEKIKTIGDCYMAATGLPVANPEHAHAMSRFAMGVMEKSKELKNPLTQEPLQLRIGLHSGDCVAGVVGYTSLFHGRIAFDVWGDAVNIASRMESHGQPGKVHCSEATKELIEDDFYLESLDAMEIKGKGMMNTYFINGEKGQAKARSYVVCAPGELRLQELQTVLEHVMSETRNLTPMEAHSRVAEINEAICHFHDQIISGRTKRAHFSRVTQRRNESTIKRGNSLRHGGSSSYGTRIGARQTLDAQMFSSTQNLCRASEEMVMLPYEILSKRRAQSASAHDGTLGYGQSVHSEPFVWEPSQTVLRKGAFTEERTENGAPLWVDQTIKDERRLTRKIVRFDTPVFDNPDSQV